MLDYVFHKQICITFQANILINHQVQGPVNLRQSYFLTSYLTMSSFDEQNL